MRLCAGDLFPLFPCKVLSVHPVSMKDIRFARELFGLWSVVPMPWTRQGVLDEGALQRNVERLALIPCDGIYSTDSDGEFYALELDEFRLFVEAFSRCMEPLECGIQVGVTWANTKGVIDRIKACLDCGISTVHIGYPFWMPLNDDDVKHFWDDLARSVPNARWVHYNTPRSHVVMNGSRYGWLAKEFPEQFIGTKLGTQDFLLLSDIIGATPHISHILTDYAVVPGMILGGRGVCSFWVNTLPHWQRRLVDFCQQRRWEEAMCMQLKFNRWESECVAPLVDKGYLHGIIGKARGAITGFLEDEGYTRPPYRPVPAEEIQELTTDFRVWWKEELAKHIARMDI